MLGSISCMRLSLSTSLLSLLITSIFGATASAVAATNIGVCEITNGNFENNFLNWETIGHASIEITNNNKAVTQHNKAALLDTFSEQTADIVELAQFLETRIDLLNSFGEVYEGSALKTNITVNAGDILSFDWNFLTDESHDGDYQNDFAFLTLSGLNTLKIADTFSMFNPAQENSTNLLYETGFHTYTYTFTTSGTYTLGMGVVDVGEGSFDSGLIIDNVSLRRPLL